MSSTATSASLDDISTISEKRIRKLTPKAMEGYESTRNDYIHKLEKARSSLTEIILQNQNISKDDRLGELEKQLTLSIDSYNTIASEFVVFLHRMRTEESQQEEQAQTKQIKNTNTLAAEFHSRICENKHRSHSVSSYPSKKTSTSGTSASSRHSSTLSKKLAKAEAARTRVKFAEQEAALRKEKALFEEREKVTAAAVVRQMANIDADLQLLHQQRDAEVAEVEVDALQTSLSGSRASQFESIPQQSALERTASFVREHSSQSLGAEQHDVTTMIYNVSPALPTIKNANITHTSYHSNNEPLVTHTNLTGGQNMSAAYHPYNEPPVSHCTHDVNGIHTHQSHANVGLNASAPTFYPDSSHVPNVGQSRLVLPRIKNDPTHFLVRKDLLLSRLSHFNDKPENYRVWKLSFQNIMSELGVSPFEELDLLVKWLGPESGRHAVSIRTTNASNPHQGLARLWDRLDERYGYPEMVENALNQKLKAFPVLTNKDSKKLYELSDIVSEIEAVKEDSKYASLLSYYDSSHGVSQIVNKLPYSLKEKWVSHASKYKSKHDVAFPPFTVFAAFIREVCKMKNDPSLCYDSYVGSAASCSTGKATHRNAYDKPIIAAKKTDTVSQHEVQSVKYCPIHNSGHSLNRCRAFKAKSIEERRKFLRDNAICFRCCESSQHKFRDCKLQVSCSECGSEKHPSALHIWSHPKENLAPPATSTSHGGEKNEETSKKNVSSKCTAVCGEEFSGKSCAKVALVRVYPDGHPDRSVKLYAIIDDQSNRSLARSDLLDQLNLNLQVVEYSLSSCGGNSVSSGRLATGCIIETLDGQGRFKLPPLLECDQIPNIRSEIPTPEVAVNHPHLKDIAPDIPALDEEAQILLLIGRDLIEVHHVLDQRTGPENAPYAQRLGLGWVIIGEACLGNIHASNTVNVNKTYLLRNGRTSIFTPCQNEFEVVENTDGHEGCDFLQHDPVFKQTKDDNKPGLSVDDREFLEMMNKEFCKDPSGRWTAPLPFRSDRPRLPNNRMIAERRAKILDTNLRKNNTKMGMFLTFMDKIFQDGHAERAPDLKPNEECWYLPVFGVYHSQKPDQVRCVFDSSAKSGDISLNNVLLTGPDFTNSLLGVLLRFRRESFAITADIQQMFYCFNVREDHRNYLRFFWYEDNDPVKEMIEYRMCVHVFGNSPSPAIATYGLRKTVEACDDEVKSFVDNDFYVDDALTSLPTASHAVNLMERTQKALKEGGLHLHKIASNREEVMLAFPQEELAKGLKNLNFQGDSLPVQRSLGLLWDLKADSFTFSISEEQKPYTRRGVLSTVNSIFDPIGFLAPVTIQGKLILRGMVTETVDWDEPLQPDQHEEWKAWRDSLSDLQGNYIRRAYSSLSPSKAVRKELHIFSDASERAISAAAYVLLYFPDQTQQLSFVMGKAKVAPTRGHTIPRLELCAAVLAAEIGDTVREHLGISIDATNFYTDSKVVLGYVHNRTRRFHTYVCNRVERIRRSSKKEQWKYVRSDLNPVDCATRGVPAKEVGTSPWLVGPRWLLQQDAYPDEVFPLLNPEDDKEVRPEVVVSKTHSTLQSSIGSERFSRFSTWKILVETMARLRHIASCFNSHQRCAGWHICKDTKTVKIFQESQRFIIRVVQLESFREELESIHEKRPLPRSSSILQLDPFVDDEGLLRVGGRLNKGSLTSSEKNPIIIPGKHHIATLLVRSFHEEVRHQGRHFTEGAVRSAGFWITGGKRLVSSIIYDCVRCRKLRGRFQYQKMADLPSDRLVQAPPFTYVGVDTFGPWSVVTRRTRGGAANSKRWAILFTCLVIRAIQIEVVEDLSSSAFVNAVRRFISLRGKVKEFRCDRGTNFVGSTDALRFDTVNVEDAPVRDFLYNSGTTWTFNSPHSSHMGGVWERMIGITRRILESMLSDNKNLTSEVLATFMAEVCAIVNSRPLIPISHDSEVPDILSPSTLLTQKTDIDKHPLGEFDVKDLYRSQWKRVKHLSDTFWCRWRKEYLQTLQVRRKWTQEQENVHEGDFVMLKDKEVGRIEWPVGRVQRVFPSADGKVRKVEVCVAKDGNLSSYIRPIVDLVLLISNSE